MTSYPKSAGFVIASIMIAVGAIAQTSLAQVGEPMGAGPGNTFGIKITHGGTTVIDRSDVPFPSDIKLNDGDGEDYVVLGSIPGTSFILKTVSDGGPTESFRTTHWYIDSVSPSDIHVPGAVSLFDPNNSSPIEVTISNIKFLNTTTATPMLLNNAGYYVSYMRNEPGHFYNLPGSGTFNQDGMGVIDVQVRGDSYMDGDLSQYTFASADGPVVSWTWSNIVNPGTGTTVTDENGSVKLSNEGGTQLGFVHELGLGVAFTGVPEPATLSMFALVPLLLRRRSRR